MPDVDSLDYTIKEYMSFIEHMKACAERINENGKNTFSKSWAIWAEIEVRELIAKKFP